uniref:Uncharacterized protein n=1 Tax=Zea mays TaxID=4577 RepID=B4FHE6_MAIZE|nr:unknown [Zea mays]
MESREGLVDLPQEKNRLFHAIKDRITYLIVLLNSCCLLAVHYQRNKTKYCCLAGVLVPCVYMKYNLYPAFLIIFQDPGYPLLKKLIGESGAKDLVREFLFEGVGSLGTKSFLEYFAEYAQEDGTVNKKRSMAGKSFGTRPWDAHGLFVGDAVDG